MAPKPAGRFKKRARSEMGQGSGTNTIEEDHTITRTNRYLFRDQEAYANYVGQYDNKTLTKCYYFDKSTQTFDTFEDRKILEYLDHWKWDSFLRINEPYHETITKAFYANLQISEDPFVYRTYVCGKNIELTLENLANWLELPNEGEETYLLRSWPQGMSESADQFKKWFKPNYKYGEPLYMTHLPSLHKLLFLLINNILIPKAAIKTNMERGPTYYLRHLITLEGKFNIPFIILNHMKSALSSKVACLPYGHLIQRILVLNGVNIPEPSGVHVGVNPISLLDVLPKYGWRTGLSPSGLPILKPDSRPINDWIRRSGARPNQYWNPNGPEPNPMVGEPIQPQAGQGDIPPEITQQLATLIEQMSKLNENQQTTNKKLRNLSSRFTKLSKTVAGIDEVQNDLMKRCVRYFGASNASPSHAPHEEDDDDEENEDDEVDADDDEGAGN